MLPAGVKTKRNLLAAMHFSGLDRLFQQVDGALGVIFTLHRVSAQQPPKFDPNAHLSVHPDFLDRSIAMLRKRGFVFVSMDEAVARLRRPERGSRFASLTFDDAYADFEREALPVLRSHGVPSTVYVAAGLTDGTADLWWEAVAELVRRRQRVLLQTREGPVDLDCTSLGAKMRSFRRIVDHLIEDVEETELARRVRELCWLYKVDVDELQRGELMDWPTLRRLHASDDCVLGAHTVHHYALARLTAKKAREEVIQSAQVMEAALGARPAHFAYPFGYPAAAAHREFEILRRARFRTAVTTRPGMLYEAHAGALHALPRVSLNGHFQRARYLGPLSSGLPSRLAQKGRALSVR